MTTLNIVVVLGLLGAVICAPTGDLAGPEFLEVFMRSREPRRSAYYITDNIIHNEVKTTEATTTELPVTETTESTTWIEPEEREVVKVSVTTSIGRQLSKPEEPRLASTADEPTITAVQRSHFGVDESSGELSIKQEAPESRFTVERSQNGENTSFTVRQIHQGDSSSSFTIQTKIPDKVEERTSYSVDAKQEKAVKEEETVVEQRTFSTEARSTPSKSPAKNWNYNYTPKEKEHQNWPANYERNSRDYRQKNWEYQERVYGEPEKNYEIDESVSVMSNGRVHGAQGSTTNPNKNGYVVEGSNYRKYRVEEKTPDGFIVGEYGVVSHDDGSLRGVRYTADSNINPRLIYDALVKFLSLK